MPRDESRGDTLMIKKTALMGGLACVAAVALAVAPGLKLTPATISNGAKAYWTPIQMPKGASNHVLVLEKMVPTSAYEAAAADIGRIAGTPYSDLDAVGWT